MNPDLRVYESDRDWIARGGQLGCRIPDIERRDAEEGWNDGSNRGLLPEHDLWAAVIAQAIEDVVEGPKSFNGAASVYGRTCNDCHLEMECSCVTHLFKREDIRGEREGLIVVVNVPKGTPYAKPDKWTTGQKKGTYKLELYKPNIWVREDGSLMYKALNKRCREFSQHTYQACALRWFESKEFEDVCERAGMRVEVVRKRVKEALSGKARSIAGLSSETGSGSVAPEVGG